MTRVVFLGRPEPEKARIYNLVKQAQQKGIELVRQGRRTRVVDEAARNFLDAETPHAYKHSLGHGVGIEVHESPNLSARSSETLKSGNVVTVEPGVYIPGWGGVRLEDMVLVTAKGCEVLTHAPKEINRVTI
jgi:Xaa-Pro aminopeptidase